MAMTPREAGIQAFYADESTSNTLQGLNAAFDAYEAAAMPAIKALEWEEEPNEPGWWTATVEPLRLFYEVRVNGRGETRALLPGEFWKPFDGDIYAAKAAAQTDFETRISALVPALSKAKEGQ